MKYAKILSSGTQGLIVRVKNEKRGERKMSKEVITGQGNNARFVDNYQLIRAN
jgi:hypothetical protein